MRVGRLRGAAAVVLGSTQDRSVVDAAAAAAAGVDVVRRPTGGGAVLVAPDAQVWLDLWIPRGDALWRDDIVAGALWLGRAWAEALTSLGAPALEVRGARATRDPSSDLVCFAGRGPGEVLLTEPAGGGAKVVGIAQRRTRMGARLHTTAPLRWEPAPLLGLLRPERRSSLPPLDDVAAGLRDVVAPSRGALPDGELLTLVEDAFMSVLP